MKILPFDPVFSNWVNFIKKVNHKLFSKAKQFEDHIFFYCEIRKFFRNFLIFFLFLCVSWLFSICLFGMCFFLPRGKKKFYNFIAQNFSWQQFWFRFNLCVHKFCRLWCYSINFYEFLFSAGNCVWNSKQLYEIFVDVILTFFFHLCKST